MKINAIYETEEERCEPLSLAKAIIDFSISDEECEEMVELLKETAEHINVYIKHLNRRMNKLEF